MSLKTGIEVLRVIHAERVELPVIVMSADPANEARALEAGATAFLLKRPESLMSELRRLLDGISSRGR